MWPRFHSHPEHSAFVLLFCMAFTRLLSECQMLYDWDYDEDAEKNMGFRVRDPSDLSYNSGTGSSLVHYGDEFGDDVNSMKEVQRSQLAFPMNVVSRERALELRERLKGLYAMLKMHPALMDRRLQVGSEKPHIPSHHSLHHTSKRSFNVATSQPVCPSRTGWRLLHVARDMNDTEVEVFQPRNGSLGHQWFYITTCDNSHADMNSRDCPHCCRGINTNRYHSRCTTMKTFVIALVRKPHEPEYDWKWIQIDSSCTCSISNA